jgi:hypothetical protein
MNETNFQQWMVIRPVQQKRDSHSKTLHMLIAYAYRSAKPLW